MSDTGNKPHILLTNDDGIDARGMTALRQAVNNMGEITVCAPAGQRSASSHAVSVMRELLLETREQDGRTWGYALDGTPADCVKFALTHPEIARPNIVISGINPGENTGNNILYSGTVGAAAEAALYDLPAIALSVSFKKRANLPAAERDKAGLDAFASAMTLAPYLVDLVLKHGLPRGTILNVNVPSLPPEEIEGIVVTRQGQAWFIDEFAEQSNSDGNLVFMNVGKQFIRDQDHPDGDASVLDQNQISITPLLVDRTHHEFREELKKWALTFNLEHPHLSDAHPSEDLAV